MFDINTTLEPNDSEFKKIKAIGARLVRTFAVADGFAMSIIKLTRVEEIRTMKVLYENLNGHINLMTLKNLDDTEQLVCNFPLQGLEYTLQFKQQRRKREITDIDGDSD